MSRRIGRSDINSGEESGEGISSSDEDDGSTSEPTFLSENGETFFGEEKVADFSLKLIGEVHSGKDDCFKKDSCREGRWLVSMTGLVFSTSETRIITLTTSDFDSSKKLLKRVRTCFTNGSIRKAPPDKLVDKYWQWLQSSYDPDSAIKVKQTDHLGLQEDNYWLLDNEIHLWRNSVVAENDKQFYLATDKENQGTWMYMYSTDFNKHLLDEDYMLKVLKGIMEKSSYFTVNQISFKMAFSFCLTRLLRLKDTEETWGESNIGLLFSKEKNCGKSLTLRLLAKLQGLRSQREGLLFAGGNQNTSGTSNKVVLEVLARTTLVVMIDDPLFSKTLGEFLQQIQGGLSQGSANAGVCTPKGSILISSNSDAVERIEGRIQRIDYRKDESFQLDDHKEQALKDLAEKNKGFLVALTMRYVELWYKLKDMTIPVLQNAIRASFPNQQLRWVRGQAYTLLTFAMIHALVDHPCNLLKVISELSGEESKLTPLQQLQVAAFEKMKSDPLLVCTWVSPFCTAFDKDGNKVSALAFSKEGIHSLGKDVSIKDIEGELPGPKCIAQPQAFASSAGIPVSEVRHKKKGEKASISKRAHKVPEDLLSNLFIHWVKHFHGLKKKPDRLFSQEEFASQTNPLATLHDEIASLEMMINSEIKEFHAKQAEDQEVSCAENLQHSVVQALTPNTKRKFDAYSHKEKQAFIEGYMCGSKSHTLSPRPVEGKSSTAATPIHNTSKIEKKNADGKGKGKTKKSEREKCNGEKKQPEEKSTKEKEQVNRTKTSEVKKRKRQEAGRDKIEHQCSPPIKVSRAGDQEMSDPPPHLVDNDVAASLTEYAQCANNINMADGVGKDVLKFTLVHDSKTYPVELPMKGRGGKGPAVEDLANLAAQLTEVPRGSQRLIFKGQSLTEFNQPLKSLGVKKGSKVKLIGKKFDPLQDKNMKALVAAEKKADDIEKRLNENLEELQGIEKGHFQPQLVTQALKKLPGKIHANNEEFMKILFDLDALHIDSSLKQARDKRKSLVQRIQLLQEKIDKTTRRIKSLKKKS